MASRWSRFVLPALLVAAFPSVVLEAQPFRYLAFGDSITDGFNDHPNCLGCVGCGYPGRLSTEFGCTGLNCEVVNHGLSGEKTMNGITRLNNLFFAGDPDWDLMMLMHGSNDIFDDDPVIPEEAVRDNLKQMAYDAAELGIETLHASIIWFHPWGDRGHGRDDEIENLRDLVSVLATSENRSFADAWNLLCPVAGDIHGHPWAVTGLGCFNQHYCEDDPNGATQAAQWVLGHPNPSGFDMMSDMFRNTINAVPAPGLATVVSPSGAECETMPTLSWTKESPDGATWYQAQVETDLGATVFDSWLPEADISAVAPDPLIPGVCIGTACSVTLAAALTQGDYVWRVRGRNPKGRSAFTADAAFSILPASLNLENDTVADTRVEAACNQVVAGNLGGGDYGVAASGNLTLDGGTGVEIHDGFWVADGGTLNLVSN
ncbi:MAG: SGNH/GDSL hydrolase family protein [Thermoanaerobaculia bacterium]